MMKRSIAVLVLLAVAFGCEAPPEAAQEKAANPAADTPGDKTPGTEPKAKGSEAAQEKPAVAPVSEGQPAVKEGRFLSPQETLAIQLAPGETQHFGANFSLAGDPIDLADALGRLDEVKDTPIRLKGKVLGSCLKKGCWMKLQAPEGTEPVRVSFEGYGFFVPPSAKGADAVLEGTLQKKVETESARRHYAEDRKATPEEMAKIQGDKVTVRFVATGVDLTLPSI